MEKERYNHFNSWLKNKFGERTLKICLDGDFSCPNRDGSKSYGGCIFCGERGSGENTVCGKKIEKQVFDFINSYRGQRANKFIAYFQNFSNTYAPLEILKEKYDSALCDERIVALAIATRPDCINEEIAKLISLYSSRVYVWVELGLQTSNNEIGEKLNRKYTKNDFENAVSILNKYNIDVVTHIMVGLLVETKQDVLNTVEFVNSQKVLGVKIHSTYVIKGTQLERMFLEGNYKTLEIDEYIDTVVEILLNLRPDIVVHRITGDAPKSLLVAPEWVNHKKRVLNSVDRIMKENDFYQGQNYKEKKWKN